MTERWKTRNFGEGALAGAVIAIGSACVVLAFFDLRFETISAWLKEWQTLATGMLALAGAAMTVRAINRQIAQTRDQHEDERRRRARAARAVMPGALSEIVGYAQACIEYGREMGELGIKNNKFVKTPDFPNQIPPYPNGVTSVLQECIEFGDGDAPTHIADLIRYAQVQRSRLKGHHALINVREREDFMEIATEDRFKAVFHDAVNLHARAERMFSYARIASDEDLTVLTTGDIGKSNLCLALSGAEIAFAELELIPPIHGAPT